MKISLQTAICAMLPVVAASALHASMLETANEFQFHADLDGDGRTDMVILDKASGGFRAAYQQAPGVWTWSAARSTGMAGITGAAAGKWFATDRDGFVVVSPVANRAHIVRAETISGTPVLNQVFGQSLGPAVVAAPDIGGVGNTAHSDLWMVAVENGSPSPVRTNTIRHNGATFSPISNLPRARTPHFVRSVVLKDGGPSVIGFLDTSNGMDDRFSVITLASGSAVEVVFATVPEGSRWTSGKLGGGSLHHVLTWTPGESVFRSHAVQEGPPNTFALAAPLTHSVDEAIGYLSIVQSANGPRLVVIDEAGETAAVYSYNGAVAPVAIEAFTASEGQQITGLMPTSGGGFQLLSGASGTGVSASVQPYLPQGDGFVAGAAQVLPGLRPAALRANVFAFSSEPFVNPDAIVLARYSAPEWSSDPVLAGDQLTVRREVFGGTAAGLGAKAPVSIGTVPMGTAFALTSQYSNTVSLHSYDAGDGRIGPSVEISPLPGIRSQGFWLSFQASAADAPVLYRLNNGPWTTWSGESVFIFQDTDIAYFVRHPITNEPSAIQVAQYRFDVAPHLIDSDDDGVPDFVEIGLKDITNPVIKLDPLGGVDSDGDGFSDLTELLFGTDPSDNEVFPGLNDRLEEGIAFRMRVAPRPIDGTNGARAQVALGNRLELYALDGTSLGGSAAQALATPGVIGSGHSVDNVVADRRMGLVTILTEPVFPIATVDPDKDRGREIAGVYVIPQGVSPTINYTPGGGSMEDEINAWIAAATLAYNTAERPLVSGNWNELDTLSGLILEKKIEDIFLSRGLEGLTAGSLTLFGGRGGDTGRFKPSADDLASLRERVSNALPGFDIVQLFESIAASVAAAPASGVRAAATAIFRTSSANSNDFPPGTYLPPFDVLRSFVRGQPIPEPYASEVGITPAAISAAQLAVANIIAGLPSRPVESFTVVVQADSFEGACHRVLISGTDLPLNLFVAEGQPYTPPIGFSLLPGTKLHVFGYTDISSSCIGTDLELIDLVVLEFPPTPVVDANQNLLPDDWEWVFLLGDADPFEDADMDGVSNLQELLDGTDPMNSQSKPLDVVDLSPPPVEIFIDQQEEDGVIYWNYPPDYADHFTWVLETSPDLVNWTINPDVVVLEVEPGLYAMELPGDLEGFYRVRMVLK